MKKIKQGILSVLLAGLSVPVLAAQINVNEAGKDEMLKALSGLTAEQADKIIKYREDQGAIVKLHELYMLGVGSDVIENNYSKLTVGEATWGDKSPDRSIN